MDEDRGEITRLARRWTAGDDEALQRLVEVAYDDLRAIAHRQLGPSSPHATLRTTALVNEVYLRLADVDEGAWASRAHFFAFCSKAMRHILIDYARRRQAARRGGDRDRVPLSDEMAVHDDDVTKVLAVEEALAILEERDARLARVVECRFFGGLTNAETGEALDVSTRTVERDWLRARTYLRRILREQEAGDDPETSEDGPA